MNEQSRTETRETAPRGPCDGIVIVDLSSIVSAPMGSGIMAELGATVIKVETETSDLAMRSNPPINGWLSSLHEQVNAGKKSILLDPKDPAGLAAIRELCRQADVFLQNSRPGVMERLGLGYEDLKAINPGLIYVSVSGYGEGNEYSGHAAYDQSIQGAVGFMPVQGGDGPPQAIYSPVADKITAVWVASAMMGALLYRERNNGVGQKVVISMLSAFAHFMLSEEMHNHIFRSVDLPKVPAPRQAFTTVSTSDGSAIGFILQRKQFEAFCAALGRNDLLDDPRFTTSPDIVRWAAELYQMVAEDIARLSTQEFLAKMVDAGIPFSRVNTSYEFINGDMAAKTGVYVDIDDAELGTMRHLTVPTKFSVSPARVSGRAPKLGEHSEEIRKQFGLPG